MFKLRKLLLSACFLLTLIVSLIPNGCKCLATSATHASNNAVNNNDGNKQDDILNTQTPETSNSLTSDDIGMILNQIVDYDQSDDSLNLVEYLHMLQDDLREEDDDKRQHMVRVNREPENEAELAEIEKKGGQNLSKKEKEIRQQLRRQQNAASWDIGFGKRRDDFNSYKKSKQFMDALYGHKRSVQVAEKRSKKNHLGRGLLKIGYIGNRNQWVF